jgi:hypothetical protein
MWLWREEAEGGFRYQVYVNDWNARLRWQGHVYLRNIGWTPESSWVSVADDSILRA